MRLHFFFSPVFVQDNFDKKRPKEPRARTSNTQQPAHDADVDVSNPLWAFSIFKVQVLKPWTVPTKVPSIQDLLQHINQLFTALTETWLREPLDAELTIDGYTMFWQDSSRLRRHRRVETVEELPYTYCRRSCSHSGAYYQRLKWGGWSTGHSCDILYSLWCTEKPMAAAECTFLHRQNSTKPSVQLRTPCLISHLPYLTLTILRRDSKEKYNG